MTQKIPAKTRPLEKNELGDLMTLSDWRACCDEGGFIDYDGFCNPVIDTTVIKVCISPTDRRSKRVPAGTTHILWYNR